MALANVELAAKMNSLQVLILWIINEAYLYVQVLIKHNESDKTFQTAFDLDTLKTFEKPCDATITEQKKII